MFHFTWFLGCALSVDEQKIYFKGKHVDKTRILYKNKGGEFQVDAICNLGYTYVFFLRNEVLPKEYTLIGLSPLHARVFSLFITLHSKFQDIHLNIIYMSAKFAHLLYTHQNCLNVQGVY